MMIDISIIQHLASNKFYKEFGIKSITISKPEKLYGSLDSDKLEYKELHLIGYSCEIECRSMGEPGFGSGLFGPNGSLKIPVSKTYEVFLEEYVQEVRSRKLNEILG
jgi:hypothetical protein